HAARGDATGRVKEVKLPDLARTEIRRKENQACQKAGHENHPPRTEAVDEPARERQRDSGHRAKQGEGKRNGPAAGMEFLNQRLEKYGKRKDGDRDGPEKEADCSHQDHPPTIKKS